MIVWIGGHTFHDFDFDFTTPTVFFFWAKRMKRKKKNILYLNDLFDYYNNICLKSYNCNGFLIIIKRIYKNYIVNKKKTKIIECG